MHTTATLRKNNMLEVLKVVKKYGPMTRPQIAHKTSLTSVTVSTLIAELMKNDIVAEEGLTNSIGGRKAVLYKFNDTAYYIVGVSMRIKRISVDLYDVSANKVLAGEPVYIEDDESVENIISALARSIKQLIVDSNGLDCIRKIIGIGISVPGRVDYVNGVIYHLANLQKWVNIPLKSIIESQVGIATYIERDVNSELAYLKWQDITQNHDKVVYCDIEEGIGASVLIDGVIYHGDHGLAGEMGHTSLNPEGPRCNCGNYGCVEVYASHSAIINYYREYFAHKDLASGATPIERGTMDDKGFVQMLALRARDGDQAAGEAFARASKYLSAFLLNVINSYDPSLVIIECKWLRLLEKYFHQIVSGVFERNSFLDRNDIKVILSPVEDIYSVSASTVVLEQLFSNIRNNQFIN